ncbi:MAG: hypothetical protein DLM73_14690 [Chthoniobacterales bacterium]|nr:MAG: hypothetical protein DLM73_14690 [Chthoniobacterales bacterium]
MTGDDALGLAMQAAEANHQTALAQYEANTQRSIEAAKAGNKAGSDAIKAITLLNGGAAVAMLALIGHLASSAGEQPAVISLRFPLALFVVGTFLAVCASGMTYFGQVCISAALGHEFKKLQAESDAAKSTAGRKEKRWRGGIRITNGVAIACSIAALCCFGAACLHAYDAFKEIGNVKDNVAKCRYSEVAQPP